MFKTYTQDQPSLLPPSLDELIPSGHPVRVVNDVIDSLDLSAILASYEGGGAPSYHPAMLLKIVVYAYLRNIYSSRKMEEALKENVHFMWLSGQSHPDHNTLARFRSERLRSGLKEVFSQVATLLFESGLISLEESFVDGTKLEANAGRYTFVWGRSIQTNKAKMLARLNEIVEYADSVSQAEEPSPPLEFEELDSERIRQTVRSINEKLAGLDVPKKIRSKMKQVEKEWPERLELYERQEQIMDGRNSYSKTDPDATFMRMKEDHMRNGQLKPGYNLQLSTENQFVTCYSLHPNPTDTLTLIPHLEGFQEEMGRLPKRLIADAGYGSEQNYEYLDSEKVEAFVKHSKFHQDQKRTPDRFDSRNWPYDSDSDTFVCPGGKVFERTGAQMRQTSTGYKQTLSVYRSPGCESCALKEQCCKSEEDREISVNHRLNQYRKEANGRLTSQEGIALRKRRCCDVETVFGQLKQNKGFRRCLLRGKEKVENEVGILLLAQNLAKVAA